MSRNVFAVLLVLLCGCGDGGPVAELIGADEPQIPPLQEKAAIRIVHRPCYGSCPVYSVTIFESGEVLFKGERFVKVTGNASRRITPAEVRRLVARFAGSAFPNMDTFYSHGHANCLTYATDHPGTVTTVRLASGVKTIYFNRGCAKRQELDELKKNEQEVERAAGITEWIGAG